VQAVQRKRRVNSWLAKGAANHKILQRTDNATGVFNRFVEDSRAKKIIRTDDETQLFCSLFEDLLDQLEQHPDLIGNPTKYWPHHPSMMQPVILRNTTLRGFVIIVVLKADLEPGLCITFEGRLCAHADLC
jgi:hypothetical protein